jgi:3-oxoacyl-[acyl-carrier protein] reductase
VDLEISGRVAIVTGGSKGIGYAAAEALGRAGVRLLLTGRNEDDLRTGVARLRGSNIQATAHVADATDPDTVDVVYNAAVETYGQVDIAVCAAGGGHGPLRSFSWQDWVRHYELNVVSAVSIAMRCVSAMRERRWGRIIFVGSTAGREADPRFAAYGAAKAALQHAAKSLALAYAKDGVLTNCVLPGLTRTEGVVEGYRQQAERLRSTPAEVEKRMLELQPIAAGRAGQACEVGDAIAFLCSQRASWIAGAALLVDGGTIRVTP